MFFRNIYMYKYRMVGKLGTLYFISFPIGQLGLLGCGQSCKYLGSVVALLQGNFEKSYDFKANFEEKRAVLMRLQFFLDNFLPFNSITKLMSKNPKYFDHTRTFHGQT